jgi:Mce-associated membrane protein
MTNNHTDGSSSTATVSDEIEDSREVKATATDDTPKTTSARRPASVSVRSLVVGAITSVAAVVIGVLAWLYIGAENELDAQTRQAANYQLAEEKALHYAVNAAAMNFKDLGAWKVKLVEGTSPELKEKLTQAADSMEQILVPLQWNSTAKALVAKVRSEDGGVYVVDAFVSVLTKTMQAPEGLQSTATYSVTLDSNANWQITDVGGLDAVMPPG